MQRLKEDLPRIIEKHLIADFKRKLRGDLLTVDEADYESARKIWNGMVDKKPLLIVRCRGSEDVIHAVNFGREQNLLLSVKGGGHNISGNAVCDGGIMVDLSLMKSVKVYPEEQVAEVETGATWGDFDTECQKHALATTGGVVSTTGVAGLTLGGGVGWLVRKHGLSCDNLIGADVVTAEGILVKANENENPDLFWALRGGGGNFGVVTSMKFRLYPVGTVLGGMILYPRESAKEVLGFYREFIKTAPQELTLYAGLLTSPDGMPITAIFGCYIGDLAQGEAVLKPFRQFGSPIADLITRIPYTQMQQLLDASAPHGNRYYWKSYFLEELSDSAIDLIVSHAASAPSPFTFVLIEYYGGVAAHEPKGGTAFPHRQIQFDLIIASNWVDKQADEENVNWTRTVWENVLPYSSRKVYVNLLGVEGEDRIKEAYGKNYSRLAAIKNKYDPNNFFRLNQNIKPKTTG